MIRKLAYGAGALGASMFAATAAWAAEAVETVSETVTEAVAAVPPEAVEEAEASEVRIDPVVGGVGGDGEVEAEAGGGLCPALRTRCHGWTTYRTW